jgi:glycosyltransferase involved in cell wall biosynthesis
MSKFCIVIPTSDSLSTLPAAVESALEQQHTDYLIYVSDNASKDGSADYLSSLKDSRLIVDCCSSRLGKTENWNRAFCNAPSCDYFVMLHSDDLLHKDALAAIEAAFGRHPHASLVFGNHDILSVDGCIQTSKPMWPGSYIASGLAFDRLQVLNNAVSIVGPSFPSALYRMLGGFPLEYDFYQDMEFYHRLCRNGPAVYIPQKLGLNRGTPSRPRSRLHFYCEEISWLRQQTSAWPAAFSEQIRMTWARDGYRHIREEFPEMCQEYIDHLERNGMNTEQLLKKRIFIPRTHLHRIYKLWLTFCTALGVRQ